MEQLLWWVGVPVGGLFLTWLFAENAAETSGPPDITGEWVVISPKDMKVPQVAGPIMRGMIVGLALVSLDGESTALVEAIVTEVHEETVDVQVRKLYDAAGPATPPVPAIIRNVLKGDLHKATEA